MHSWHYQLFSNKLLIYCFRSRSCAEKIKLTKLYNNSKRYLLRMYTEIYQFKKIVMKYQYRCKNCRNDHQIFSLTTKKILELTHRSSSINDWLLKMYRSTWSLKPLDLILWTIKILIEIISQDLKSPLCGLILSFRLL